MKIKKSVFMKQKTINIIYILLFVNYGCFTRKDSNEINQQTRRSIADTIELDVKNKFNYESKQTKERLTYQLLLDSIIQENKDIDILFKKNGSDSLFVRLHQDTVISFSTDSSQISCVLVVKHQYYLNLESDDCSNVINTNDSAYIERTCHSCVPHVDLLVLEQIKGSEWSNRKIVRDFKGVTGSWGKINSIELSEISKKRICFKSRWDFYQGGWHEFGTVYSDAIDNRVIVATRSTANPSGEVVETEIFYNDRSSYKYSGYLVELIIPNNDSSLYSSIVFQEISEEKFSGNVDSKFKLELVYMDNTKSYNLKK